LTALFVACRLASVALEGRVRCLKSPLTILGGLAIALAVGQMLPLPPALASRLSPRSRQLYALGFVPDHITATAPTLDIPEPVAVRTPVSVDRASTLRWIAGALVCLALFWGVSHFTDRLGRLYLIWGSIVAAFCLNTAFALVQVTCRSGGLYGLYEPGAGTSWTPSTYDLFNTPNATVLRSLPPAKAGAVGAVVETPDQPFLFGTLMGGPGAYLAFAAIGMPLALGLLLQLMAPRGSRERLASRLGHSGHGGLVVLLVACVMASAVVVGLLAGPLLSMPFAIGLVLVGLPAAWPSGLRWTGLGVTTLMLVCLGSGLLARDVLARMPDAPAPIAVEGLAESARVWEACAGIVRDFPVFGTGLGSFASVYPFYKVQDASRTTALSSLIQWWVESGMFGLVLVAVAGLWIVWRLPGAVRRVGTADRSLVFGLIGAAAAFTLYASVHWTIELAAVALAASALGGACNRWLAGGTDLFVERG
jgi:hypothetical protein